MIPYSERRLEFLESAIILVRAQNVILDADLAKFYDVTTKRLNHQVKRNRNRFPDDFMFQLTSEEKTVVVANCDRLSRLKFSPVLPYAFNGYGIIMAASVLNTPQAIEISVCVVRDYVRLNKVEATYIKMRRDLEEVVSKFEDYRKEWEIR